MSSLANIRLTRELNKLQSGIDKVEGIIIEKPEDLMVWFVKIKGPINTPFEDGIFDLQLRFDDDYPIKPPSIRFLTPMFHPNIYRDGKICVDILQSHEWSPAQNIRTILISIISLLMDPNPHSPANREASELYIRDNREYEFRVRELINSKK
jgi:ubiquitin-conjugating enzyme E2 A